MFEISSIPEEILELIFSYLDARTLSKATQVCTQWSQIINNSSKIWKHVNIVLDLNERKSDCDFSMYMPKLRTLTYFDTNECDNLYKLSRCFPNVKVLNLSHPVSDRRLGYIFEVFPDIQELVVFNLTDNTIPDRLFLTLEKFSVTSGYSFNGFALKKLLNCCPNLVEISLHHCRAFRDFDILYLLEQRPNIRFLELEGYGLSNDVFEALLACDKLYHLYIHDARRIVFPTLLELIKKPSLRYLCLLRLNLTSSQILLIKTTRPDAQCTEYFVRFAV